MLLFFKWYYLILHNLITSFYVKGHLLWSIFAFALGMSNITVWKVFLWRIPWKYHSHMVSVSPPAAQCERNCMQYMSKWPQIGFGEIWTNGYSPYIRHRLQNVETILFLHSLVNQLIYGKDLQEHGWEVASRNTDDSNVTRHWKAALALVLTGRICIPGAYCILMGSLTR